jgi:hypothetical protein
MIFSAAFGGAYGFIAGSRSSSSGYNDFAIGASFLFAAACVALATLSIRLAMVSGRDSGGRKRIFLQLRGSSLEVELAASTEWRYDPQGKLI